jgi:hypothetical protein
MNIKKIVPNITKHIKDDLPHISPGKNAHEGLCVPEIVFTYGSVLSKMKSLPHLLKYGVGSIKEIKKSYKGLYEQPDKPSKKISDQDLNDLKSFAKKIGIGNIAFTPVDPDWLFDNTKIIYSNAIVMSIEMKHEIIATAPSKATEVEIYRTYYELNVAVNKIKDFLNSRGYNAEAGPALGGETNYPLMAEKAGMGVIGKHGVLITPEFGPSIRLAAVYTDIENLPKPEENEHLWIKDFCETCNRCVKKCPAQAIYKDPVKLDDGSQICIDYKKCAVPFSTQRGCTVCIKECTFFKNDYIKIKKRYLKK